MTKDHTTRISDEVQAEDRNEVIPAREARHGARASYLRVGCFASASPGDDPPDLAQPHRRSAGHGLGSRTAHWSTRCGAFPSTWWGRCTGASGTDAEGRHSRVEVVATSVELGDAPAVD